MDSAFFPTPTPFADQMLAAERHDLQWRIQACLRERIAEQRENYLAVMGGTVVIRGQVMSQHEKRVYLECCRHVPGVVRVVDELFVEDDAAVYHGGDTYLS
jgi:hypothetical protein